MLPAAGSGAREATGSPQTIDRYQIGACIGRGGMAEVYRGKLVGLGGFERDVAVKVLLPQLSAEPEFVNMLLDEARIAGTINHSNVVQVLDVGQDGPLFYLVMEYVDGTDLRFVEKRQERGQVPAEPLLYVIAEVLRGLEAIHTARDAGGELRRIVHRDVTPSNVLLTRSGAVKLADFGIAHATGRLTQTRHGAVKGKTRYMAPEQLDGKPIDARTDLFAVGVVLLEALLGRDAADAWHATAMGPIFKLPLRLPPGVPRDIAPILQRALSAAPGDRYQHAGEFRRDVLRALQSRMLERGEPLAYGADQFEEFLRPLLQRGDGQTAVGIRRPASGSGRSPVVGSDEGSEPSSPAVPAVPAQAPGPSSTLSVNGPAPAPGTLSVGGAAPAAGTLAAGGAPAQPLPLLSSEADPATTPAAPALAVPPTTQTVPLPMVTTQATVTLPVVPGAPPTLVSAGATAPAGPPPGGLPLLADDPDASQIATAVTSRGMLSGLATLPPHISQVSTQVPVPDLRPPGLRTTLQQMQATLSRTLRDTVLRPSGSPVSLKLLGMVLAGLLLGAIGVIAVYQARGLRREPPAPPPLRAVPAPAPPAAPPRTGRLQIVAPPGTRVAIDGVPQPAPAPHSYEVTPGAHKVRLQPPRRREVMREVEVAAGEEEQLRL